MERVQIPAARAEIQKGRVLHHRGAAGVSQPPGKEEQPRNKREEREKSKGESGQIHQIRN